jgi:hypothetical protein
MPILTGSAEAAAGDPTTAPMTANAAAKFFILRLHLNRQPWRLRLVDAEQPPPRATGLSARLRHCKPFPHQPPDGTRRERPTDRRAEKLDRSIRFCVNIAFRRLTRRFGP